MKTNVIKLVTGILCLLSLSSCTNKKPFHKLSFTDFKSPILLNAKKISLAELKSPTRLCVIPKENLLIVIDQDSAFLAKAYSLDSLKFIRSFIRSGKGSNEQMSAKTVQYDGNGNIYFSDLIKMAVFKYSTKAIKSNAKSIVPSKIIYPKALYVNRPIILADSSVIDFRQNLPANEIAVLNQFSNNGNLIKSFGQFPGTTRKYLPIELNQVFFGGISLSEDKKSIIVSYFNGDYIDVYNLDGSLRRRIHGPEQIEPKLSSTMNRGGYSTGLDKDARFGYRGTAKLKDNELLVLYDGGLANRDDEETDKLLKFTKDLVPDKFYKLSNRVFAFDIDWDSRKTYGLSMDLKGQILVYNL